MTVQAWFSTGDVDVAPGAAAVISLTVANIGATTESYALAPAGLAAGWTTIRPAHITLFGGSEQIVDVEVHAPRLPSTTAGPTALGVRIVPQSNPDEVDTVETTLHVTPTYDRTVNILQPALRTRRRATFELMVENRGNSQASCRLHLIDPTHRLDGDFDPPAVGVEPGGSTLVRLKIRATRRQWERRSRSIPFRVEADQQGTPTVVGNATFVQAPMLPERLWWRLFVVLLLGGALAGAWFGLIRPEIDRAAERAVDQLEPIVPVTTVAGQLPVEVVTTTTLADVPAEAVDDGEAFSTVLPTGAGRGEQATNQYTVPAGMTFEVTDIVVQNTYDDLGKVELRVGDVPFTWDLVNLAQGFDARQQFVTPLVVEAGGAVSARVTCTEIGDAGAATCAPNIVISGVLRHAPASADDTAPGTT